MPFAHPRTKTGVEHRRHFSPWKLNRAGGERPSRPYPVRVRATPPLLMQVPFSRRSAIFCRPRHRPFRMHIRPVDGSGLVALKLLHYLQHLLRYIWWEYVRVNAACDRLSVKMRLSMRDKRQAPPAREGEKPRPVRGMALCLFVRAFDKIGYSLSKNA